jgi:peptide/nickel transport system permease protein
MFRFALRRIFESVPLMVLLSILVFALFKAVPGDYLTEMELNPAVSQEWVEKIRNDYGLNRPVPVQYGLWLAQVTRGNFGYSFAQRRPATDLIWERLTGTLVLTLGAFSLVLMIAVPFGVLCAIRAGGWIDRIGLWVSLIGLSLPTVISSLFFLYFAYWSGWFPLGGSGTVTHAVLPSVTLAIPTVALFLRTLRMEMLDVQKQQYVVAAAAKGLPRLRVLWHALRNAANPLISLSGVTLGGLLSGAVIVEKVFGWPGLGSLTVDSILARDLYVALNCVLVSAVLVILANLLADVLLAWNDPRIRYQ